MIVGRIGDNMFNRKFSSNIRRKKRMIISSIILLVVFLGIGYSAFSTNLGINGTLNVSKYDQTLYGVLEKAAKKGYAREYTGEHQDSMAGVGTEKIYHWYAPTGTAGNTLANEILDKNNVIFADHCWKMIRTTDTGGVKMIYNGEPENGQCLNTRGNHVGYDSRTTQSMSTTYYYGTSYTYDKTNNVFSLDGTVTTGTIQTGQYTCKQTISTGTCATLYLVDTLSSGTTYYVLPLNSNSNYSQFGMLPFNQNRESLAYAGYMYNTRYLTESENHQYNIYTNNTTINTSWYYSDTIDYGNIVTNQYTLTNPIAISTLSDNNELVGKYVLSTGGNGSDTKARYILAISGNRIYYRELISGDLNITLTSGNSYTDNGNGTYTINDPTEFTYINWYNGGYHSNEGKYVCDGSNSTCSNLKHLVRLTYQNRYYYGSIEYKYKYSDAVTYNGTIYTLSGDIKEIWDIPNSDERAVIATHHYSCLDTGTTCSPVYYISNYSSLGGLYYVKLTGGSTITTAISDMLNSNDVNQISSTIKIGIDAWYKKYMTNYTSKIEDTIYCNDRSIRTLNGWDPNGGNLESYLYFKNGYPTTDLSCANITDRFSIANTKAKLTYPVGLATYSETQLLNNKNIKATAQSYFLLSPSYFENTVPDISYVLPSTGAGSTACSTKNGVRPVVSLKPGTEYVSGNGSMDNPYVVE